MTFSTSAFEGTLRRVVGGVFAVSGAFKMALWPAFFGFCGALASRDPAQVLGEAARPALALTALVVPPLEAVCGALLWRGRSGDRSVRVAAALLALDMAGAIVVVGVPGRSGKSVEMGGVKVGAEPWRLALEVSLLLACAWLAARRRP